MMLLVDYDDNDDGDDDDDDDYDVDDKMKYKLSNNHEKGTGILKTHSPT